MTHHPSPITLTGYADRLSVRSGDTIRFMVSCREPEFRADLVRLIHGDENPHGPGFKEHVVPSAADSLYRGEEQRIHPGSYLLVDDETRLRLASLSLGLWVFPTLFGGERGLLTKWSANDRGGYGLFLDDEGRPRLRTGAAELRSKVALPVRQWTFVAASIDAEAGRLALVQRPLLDWTGDGSIAIQADLPAGAVVVSGAPLLIAAASQTTEWGRASTIGHFDGKLGEPWVTGRALPPDELMACADSWPPADALAAWDFAADHAAVTVIDRGSHGLGATVINSPTRAVTSHRYDGSESDPRLAPEHYSAIHFHSDDLDDCAWNPSVELTIPHDLPSGIYALRCRAGDAEDHIPFVVRPIVGKPTARVAVQLATNTYLAYANEQGTENEYAPALKLPRKNPAADAVALAYLRENSLLSLYDFHADGSGVCLSSRLRPILNMRPKARARHIDDPHAFPADLCLTDWLDHEGIAVDIFTDEDLHHDGEALLAPYKAVLSCSHPEYWSGPMLDAMHEYLWHGGRHLYLGGNGYYWVTSYCPHRPHLIEVRRWGGTGAWKAEPGQYHHATTGELGGLWRNRGRAPQQLFGIGFTAQGFDEARSYVRSPRSSEPDVAWIFDEIEGDTIGDQPNLILGHGAAGHETDRYDLGLGTPPQTVLLATATDFSDSYQAVIEDLLMSDSMQGGAVNPRVRADMVYLPYPNGGAVFSVGSIAWIGALSANNYDNPIARITGNVVRRFAE